VAHYSYTHLSSPLNFSTVSHANTADKKKQTAKKPKIIQIISAKSFISQPKFEIIYQLKQNNADRKRDDRKLNVRHQLAAFILCIL